MEHSAVVRLYTTTQAPDHESPWQYQSPQKATGSGVVIGEGLVLTGAHVVADATFVQVQKLADPGKYVARVESVCHDADLAVLRVDEAEFMAEVMIPELGDLPALGDPVSVVWYPVGGEEISITEGVVSRIEVQLYAHSQRHLLAITVDAAINHGNSGGPVIKDDKVIGIAFQSLQDAENIGEMVPAPIIRHFLESRSAQREVKLPSVGIHWQNLENLVLRESVGLKRQTGVLVRAIEFGSSAWGALEPGDVLLEIDGHAIANNGTIRYADRYRTSFWVLLGERSIGECLDFRVLRGERVFNVAITLAAARYLVPRRTYDRRPTWFIYGGVVFQVLSADFLRCWEDWTNYGPKEFLNLYFLGRVSEQQQEVVIISQVLADEVNVGYEVMHTEVLKSVNGCAPRDMAHFVGLMDECVGTVELLTSRDSRIVFDAEKTREAGPRILAQYGIPADRSQDLMA